MHNMSRTLGLMNIVTSEVARRPNARDKGKAWAQLRERLCLFVRGGAVESQILLGDLSCQSERQEVDVVMSGISRGALAVFAWGAASVLAWPLTTNFQGEEAYLGEYVGLVGLHLLLPGLSYVGLVGL